MTSGIDVDRYFERIEYSGPRKADLETLQAIQLRHVEAIAFENLDRLLRWPVRLDAQSLHQKLVLDRRGGGCFELNLLLGHVLKQLGFRVRELAARTLWNVPEGMVPPRGHMLMCLDLEGCPYIVDVGFGAVTPAAPLRLAIDIEQSTHHEPFRLIRSGDGFVMQAKILHTWMPLYRFDLQEQFLVDYEVMCWYMSTHPSLQSPTGLMASRSDRKRRYVLRGNHLAVHHSDLSTERRLLTTVDELQAVLEHTFRLTLPDGRELQAALERVVTRAA